MNREPTGVFVHPQALCESNDVGPGTRIWAFAHVMEGATIGSNCNVGDHAFVEGGARVGSGVTIKNGVLLWDQVTIEDDVFLGPGVIFTNDLIPRSALKKSPDELLPTRVGRGATVGAGAVIVCGIEIGSHAFIGAGGVVIGNVLANALMIGNPARQAGWVCVCGLQLPPDLKCPCGREFLEDPAGIISEAKGI